MGRRKIEIKKLENARNRNATFKKRRQGILKKAHELAILTDSRVTLSIKNGDSLENHVFNDQIQSMPETPIPVVTDITNVAASDITRTPVLDDDAIEDTIVVCATPEQALQWPFDPMDMNNDENLDSIFHSLDLSVTNQIEGCDLDFNSCPSSLGLFGYSLLTDWPNDQFLSSDSHDACNWLAPLLEFNTSSVDLDVG